MPKVARNLPGSGDPLFSSTLPMRIAPISPPEEKPLAEITLADLLQCSPDVLASRRESEHRTSIFDTFRRSGVETGKFGLGSSFFAAALPIPIPIVHHSSPSAASHLNLISLPNTPTTTRNNLGIECDNSANYHESSSSHWSHSHLSAHLQAQAHAHQGSEGTTPGERKVPLTRPPPSQKRLYKRNPQKSIVKIGIGRIIESPAAAAVQSSSCDSRGPKRQKKKTLGEEMVAEISSTVSHL